MSTYRVIVGTVCLLALLLAGLSFGGTWPVFIVDFEDPALANRFFEHRPQADDALTIDCSVSRIGNCSQRSHVAPNAEYVSANAFRSEADAMNLRSGRYGEGDRFVYRFSLRLEEDWTFDTSDRIDIVWQFKRFSARPDAFLAVKGEALVLRVGPSHQQTLLPSTVTGEWMDIELDVTWSMTPSGRINGVVTLSDDHHPFEYLGPTMGQAESTAGYLKWGLYKPGSTDDTFTFAPRTVWHDEVSVVLMEHPF
ncbi:heparin lyase I family protein [Desulfonatronum parangueonense]